MWMMVWRPLVVLAGLFGALIAAATGTAASVDQVASGTLAGFVIVMMVFQGVVSLGLIVAGIWTPLTRLFGRPSSAA